MNNPVFRRASACLLLSLPVFAFAAAPSAPASSPATSSSSTAPLDPRAAAVKTLNEKMRAALDAVRADQTLTPDQRREKISATLKDFRAQRESLLGTQPGTGASGNSSGAAAKALNDKTRATLDSIRGDKTLTPDQRRDKMTAALKDFRAQRESLQQTRSGAAGAAAAATSAAPPTRR